jgi:hypothetical protein
MPSSTPRSTSPAARAQATAAVIHLAWCFMACHCISPVAHPLPPMWQWRRRGRRQGDSVPSGAIRRAAPGFWLPGRRHRPQRGMGAWTSADTGEQHDQHKAWSCASRTWRSTRGIVTHREKVATGTAAARPLEGVTDGDELPHYSPFVGASSQAAPAARSRKQPRLWKVRSDREMNELGGVRETTPPASIRTYDGFTLVRVLIMLLALTTRFRWCCIYG